MDIKVNYAGITRRVMANAIDHVIMLGILLLFYFAVIMIFAVVFENSELGKDEIEMAFDFLESNELLLIFIISTFCIILEILMITRFGGTPGKLLFGIRVKDANTLKNVTTMQATIRCVLRDIVAWIILLLTNRDIALLITIVLSIVLAIFDKRKQFFHDKIAKTVVIDNKSSEACCLNANYVGVTRRVIANVIDYLTIKGISLVCVIIVRIFFSATKSQLLIIRTCLSFLPSMVLGVLMIKRFGCTPGQFLCLIRVKDANTLKNVTLVQAIIRYASFEVIRSSIFLTRRFAVNYTSEWWFKPLSILIIMVIILIFISAMLDRRKQFFHDKVAGTVAIDYKPSS